MERRRRLGDRLTGRAAELLADRLHHDPTRRDALEGLGESRRVFRRLVGLDFTRPSA
jgi:hypothetical protein